MKLNLGAGDHPIHGYVNLDKNGGGDDEWHSDAGLWMYDDETIDGITISHMLMYVDTDDWPFLFGECYRVLKPGQIIRITEDSTQDPNSERYAGNPNDLELIVLTSPSLVKTFLSESGFMPFSVEPGYTMSNDIRMIQRWHGEPPKVFHVEGVKYG